MVYDARGNQLIQPDPVLTNISVGWNAEQWMIGNQIMPVVRVGKQAGKYYVFGLSAYQLPFNGTLRAPGAMANETTGIDLSNDSFYADEHALEIRITPEEREMAVGAPIDPDKDGAELVVSKLHLGREIAVRDHVYNTTIYPADHVVTLAGTAQWNDKTTSDPIGVIRAAQAKLHSKIFRPANTAVIPYEVMLQLEDHPAILERVAFTERSIATPELVASVLGLEKVLVPGAGYVSNAQPPQQGNLDPADLGYVWGKNVWLGYVPQTARIKEPAFGYTFVNPISGANEWTTDRRQDRDHIADIIRTRGRWTTKVVTKDANEKAFSGYLIQNAVA